MSPSAVSNGQRKQAGHPTPSLFAHAVLRTTPANYRPMVAFYIRLLNATIVHESPVLTFLRYDEEHHRIAIIQTPGVVPKPEGIIHAGLDHLAFTYDTLPDLARVYTSLKSPIEGDAIRPIWCVNHGPTTSMYYRDPDGNKIELQVDNFESKEAADAFMIGELFAVNPIGTDFEPEAWAADVLSKAGQDGLSLDEEEDRKMKKRREIGARMEIPAGF